MYEYRVIPAPNKGQKVKGIKAPEDRFANTLEEVVNAEAANGWEFTRAETLPSEERSGFRATNVVYRSVLIFRRTKATTTPDYPTAPAVSTPATEAPLVEDDQDSSSANA